jgi:integrase
VLVTARPTVEEVLVRAPRWLDVVRLLECVSDIGANDPQGLYLLILLAVVTGLRTGDVLRLRVEDFESAGDETGGVALWWARNRKGRKVKVCGIPAVVEALVTTRLMELPERQERFFFWPSFPYPLWKRLRERAKVVALRPQALRRAAGAVAGATAIQRAGVQQLQHSSARVFRRYYEDREQAAIALASSLFVPELPRMPAFVLGKLDRRGRRWAAELVV